MSVAPALIPHVLGLLVRARRREWAVLPQDDHGACKRRGRAMRLQAHVLQQDGQVAQAYQWAMLVNAEGHVASPDAWSRAPRSRG